MTSEGGMAQILLVEDQIRLAQNVSRAIQEAGYEVRLAHSLVQAAAQLDQTIHLIVLDLMLPDGNGLDWLSNLRAQGDARPVLILTARDSVPDRVTGLDAGADDYLVKPFALDELLARIRVLLRREDRQKEKTLTLGNLVIDLVNRTATRDSTPLQLQNRQWELLTYLMRHSHQIVTREMIARDVWKEPTATWSNVIEVHINQLRKQLNGSGRPAILHTVRGQGYVLGDPT